MPLTTTAALVAQAAAGGHGVAAFNVITLEHAEAIADGAQAAGRPAILQVSQNAVRFHGGRLAPLAAGVAALAEQCAVPLAVHLDHVQDVELLHRAAGSGISSVMFDGSTLDYADNVATTAQAADWAHQQGLWLEAELGEVGGKDGAHAPGVRTDPGQAADFVAATGVDALAVAVGSSHAMVDRSAVLDLALVGRLRAAVAVPLVLHGSSGVADQHLAEAVAAGIVKVNIGTILNVAFSGAVRQFLAGDDRTVDPRRYLAPARQAMGEVVQRLVGVIGGDGPGGPGR